MNTRTLTITAGAIALAGLAAGCASVSTPHAATTTGTTAPAAAYTPPAPAPSPDVSYQVSGDYSIPGSIYGQVELVGEIDLTNTGSQGADVRCRMGWQSEGQPDWTARRTASLPAGASKVLRFKVPIGSFAGNGENEVNLIQDWQNAHSAATYGDGRCVITGTF